jgi:hypothetical protein
MGTRASTTPTESEKRNVSEKLDALNAKVRRQPIPCSAIRRSMEATLENKSKKQRSSQRPASASWKP